MALHRDLRWIGMVAMLGACHSQASGLRQQSPLATGADLAFSLGGSVNRTAVFHWLATPPGDTIRPPMPISRTVIVQQAADWNGEPAFLQILSVPAWDWHDTILVRQRDLHPIWEHSRSKDRRIRVDYQDRRVRWLKRRADSTLSQGDSTYASSVFAFNQVEMVVRSMPLRVGRSVIVPFYSEGTPEVEADTITVISGPSGTDTTWTIRFADAVIYSVYRIHPVTREVIDAEVFYRPKGTKYRRVTEPR